MTTFFTVRTGASESSLALTDYWRLFCGGFLPASIGPVISATDNPGRFTLTFLDVEESRGLTSKERPDDSLSGIASKRQLTEIIHDQKRTPTLHQGQFSRLNNIALAESRYAERDILMLMRCSSRGRKLGHHFL